MENGEADQSIHIDSSILIGAIDRRNTDVYKECKKTLERILRTKKMNPKVIVRISSIAFGEVLKFILERDIKERERLLTSFYEDIEKLEAEYVETNPRVWEIALEIYKRDDRIEPADALIVAQALSDECSAHLITRDSIVISSKKIKEIDEEMRSREERKRGLKIWSF